MPDTLVLTEMLARDADAMMPAFRKLVGDMPYERKGILFSEMYFFWLLARSLQPRRILESGRARGQSTLILSLCFPQSEIISVEFDSESPDVAVAAERLKGRNNVRQLFGDATKMLPEMARSGDVALIDGPKGFRGLRLALRMLHRGLPMVFVHDTCPGSTERDYLTRHMPETLYSDRTDIAAKTHVLDQGVWDDLAPERRWPAKGTPPAGYGFSLACLPRVDHRNYNLLLLRAVLDGLSHRLLKR